MWTLILIARESGALNLSSRELTELPKDVYTINATPVAAGAVSFDSKQESWWSQTDLVESLIFTFVYGPVEVDCSLEQNLSHIT
jgi:hypothetical protein